MVPETLRKQLKKHHMKYQPIKMSEYLKFALALAGKAGRIVMKDFGKPIKTEAKGIRDIVTKFDKASEKFIKDAIKRRFPDHEFLGEEGFKKPTSSKNTGHSTNTKSSSHAKSPPYIWIVDPIDGTKNFARRLPLFAISIALYKNAKPLIGVVYNPFIDEYFWAEKGHGAFRKNRILKTHKIHVSKTKKLIDAVLATGFHPEDTFLNLPIFAHLTFKSFATRRTGSAAIDICYTAAGLFDGFWEYHLKTWDVAAGSLILSEAGGKYSNFDGSPLDFKQEKFLCSNNLLHKTLVKEIKIALNSSANRMQF